jgi:hypothetical protein
MGTAWRFVTVATLILSAAEEISAQNTSIRVRSEDPTITALVAQASEWSPTFRGFLNTIGQSDGIVYVERGRCRHGGPACTYMNVTLAGPNRILRIVIDPRRADCDLKLMSSLGHELWHAIEILREPSLRSYADLYSFYSRFGHHTPGESSHGAWETHEAIKAGFTVFDEVRASAPARVRECRSA